MSPDAAAREQQVGNIDARDEENQADRNEQHNQCLTHITDDAFFQGYQ